MSDKLTQLREPLSVNDIDFRVGHLFGWGDKVLASFLAYKNARVDINRLNKVFGLGWKREHSRDNKNCIVSVWDDATNQWVSREDTGVESTTEKEKGLASDSFKRACVNFGIGIELYSYPAIMGELQEGEYKKEGDKFKATSKLKPQKWDWSISEKDGVRSVIARQNTKQGSIVRAKGQG